MPKTTFQRIVFTFLGMLLMATTMATYNKYLVYGEFSVELFRQVGIAVCRKALLRGCFSSSWCRSLQASMLPSSPQTTRFYISSSAPDLPCW